MLHHHCWELASKWNEIFFYKNIFDLFNFENFRFCLCNSRFVIILSKFQTFSRSGRIKYIIQGFPVSMRILDRNGTSRITPFLMIFSFLREKIFKKKRVIQRKKQSYHFSDMNSVLQIDNSPIVHFDLISVWTTKSQYLLAQFLP